MSKGYTPFTEEKWHIRFIRDDFKWKVSLSWLLKSRLGIISAIKLQQPYRRGNAAACTCCLYFMRWKIYIARLYRAIWSALARVTLTNCSFILKSLLYLCCVCAESYRSHCSLIPSFPNLSLVCMCVHVYVWESQILCFSALSSHYCNLHLISHFQILEAIKDCRSNNLKPSSPCL